MSEINKTEIAGGTKSGMVTEPEIVTDEKVEIPVPDEDKTGLGLHDFLSKTESDEPSEDGVDTDAEPASDDVESPETDEETGETTEEVEKPEEDIDWQKRFKDTEKWGQEQNQKSIELQKNLDELRGYVEENYGDDLSTFKPSEPVVSEEDVVKSQAEFEGRLMASEAIAREKFGDEFVDKEIFGEGSKFRNAFESNPAIEARLRNSPLPIMEAAKIVKELDFVERYSSDPAVIYEKIKEEVTKEISSKLKDEIKAELQVNAPKPNKMRDAPSSEEPTKTPPGPKRLESLMKNKFA